MSFNLQKYLTENNLTIISKIREEDLEPTPEDLNQTEIDYKSLDKKKKEYADLQSKVKAIIAKHTERGPEGSLTLKNVTSYKQEVGNMPDRLKLLKTQIDQIENPQTEPDEEDN